MNELAINISLLVLHNTQLKKTVVLDLCNYTCHEQLKFDDEKLTIFEWYVLPFVNMTIKGWIWYQGTYITYLIDFFVVVVVFFLLRL